VPLLSAFTNLTFIFYFLPVALLVYNLQAIFNASIKSRNIFLLVISLMFYFWLEPGFIVLILFLVLINYHLSKKFAPVTRGDNRARRKYYLTAILINCCIFLGLQLLTTVIRYGGELQVAGFSLFHRYVLPIGMGIVTLRVIGYATDVYNGEYEAEADLLNFALYVCFFPSIISGPLVNYGAFRAELSDRPFQKEKLFSGAHRFLIGLGKKILLANNLAVISDCVFTLSETSDSLSNVPVLLAATGLFAFFLQVYYDFSSYSDMAIGISNCLGFSAPEDFDYPYASNSMTDFCERWHASIKSWFWKYVKEAMEQKKKWVNKDQKVVHVFIAFLLMGFWYKGSIGVLLWMFLHTFLRIVERVVTFEKRNIPKPLTHAYVLFTVFLSWGLFRAGGLYHVLLFFRNLFGLNQNGFGSALALTFVKEYWPVFLLSILFAFPIAPMIRKKADQLQSWLKTTVTVIYLAFLFILPFLIMVFVTRGLYVPYSYFHF